MERYNNENKNIVKSNIKIILFDECVRNVVKIRRIISEKEEHLNLMSGAFSGRKQLVYLACLLDSKTDCVELREVGIERQLVKTLLEVANVDFASKGGRRCLLVAESALRSREDLECLMRLVSSGDNDNQT